LTVWKLVSRPPSQRSVTCIAPQRFGFALHDGGELALGADEEDVVAAQDHIAHELLRELDLPKRLLQVDDVNAVALGKDEPAHLRVPPTGLVAEVDAGFEQLFEGRGGHGLPLRAFEIRPLLIAGGDRLPKEVGTRTSSDSV
jgi:hypothetical protein